MGYLVKCKTLTNIHNIKCKTLNILFLIYVKWLINTKMILLLAGLISFTNKLYPEIKFSLLKITNLTMYFFVKKLYKLRIIKVCFVLCKTVINSSVTYQILSDRDYTYAKHCLTLFFTVSDTF